MNSFPSTGTKVSSVPRTPFQERMQVVRVLEQRVLPQTQAGFVPWSGPALCPNTGGSWNPMTAEELASRSEFSDVGACASSSIAGQSDVAARNKIGTGARAVNRLLLSLWFLLLPMIWPSSDWIGLIILSQAIAVAANLIKPGVTPPAAAALPEGSVFTMDDGEESEEG